MARLIYGVGRSREDTTPEGALTIANILVEGAYEIFKIGDIDVLIRPLGAEPGRHTPGVYVSYTHPNKNYHLDISGMDMDFDEIRKKLDPFMFSITLEDL